MNLLNYVDRYTFFGVGKQIIDGLAIRGATADTCSTTSTYCYASMPRLDDAALFARPASKLLGRHFGYSCDDLLALVLPALDGLVSVTHSNSKGLIEASALGVSKASVVAEIAALHGIDRESVIAFGDMPNDLPLLRLGGHLLRGRQRASRGARRGHARHRQQRRGRRGDVPRSAVPDG